MSEPARRRWILEGPAATLAIAAELGRHAPAGLVIGLTGPLGAGKTTFVQGLARGLEVPEDQAVTSPTFALVQHYRGRLPLAHVDVYRLGGPEELAGIDADEWLAPAGVAVIEWADRIAGALPRTTLWCHLRHRSAASRTLEISWPQPLQNWKIDSIIRPAWAFQGVTPGGECSA